jgi:hypothetical protein
VESADIARYNESQKRSMEWRWRPDWTASAGSTKCYPNEQHVVLGATIDFSKDFQSALIEP